MLCACPHSFQLSLVGAPMAIFLSSVPLLRITLLAEKQNPQTGQRSHSQESRHRMSDEMSSAFLSQGSALLPIYT